MWGIWLMSKSTRKTSRFNPAYAGNIGSSDILTAPGQVQPRVCGEYFPHWPHLPSAIGSTPRMRGIFRLALALFVLGRFNPAYAGNIIWSTCMYQLQQVQPRVCVEYENYKDASGNATGSTPRMRGIYNSPTFNNNNNRFNPAYAGNILKRSWNNEYL